MEPSKDQDYCGETLPNETYLIGSDGALQNVVVFIEASPTGAAGDPRKENILNNTGCRYSPRILALQKGERLLGKEQTILSSTYLTRITKTGLCLISRCLSKGRR